MAEEAKAERRFQNNRDGRRTVALVGSIALTVLLLFSFPVIVTTGERIASLIIFAALTLLLLAIILREDSVVVCDGPTVTFMRQLGRSLSVDLRQYAYCYALLPRDGGGYNTIPKHALGVRTLLLTTDRRNTAQLYQQYPTFRFRKPGAQGEQSGADFLLMKTLYLPKDEEAAFFSHLRTYVTVCVEPLLGTGRVELEEWTPEAAQPQRPV